MKSSRERQPAVWYGEPDQMQGHSGFVDSIGFIPFISAL